MNQRGRQSAAALAVVGQTSAAVAPMPPPAVLSAAERAVWLTITNSKPSDYFGSEHVPLLVEYVRHKCKADVIDGQIKAFQPEWLENDDGLKRYERLQKLALQTSNQMKSLAGAMRLTHLSVYRADKASLGTGKGRKPWQRDQD